MNSPNDSLDLQEAATAIDEPLPDLMYSRDVAIRLLRHAAWYLSHSRGEVEGPVVFIIAQAQKEVLQMSTGDFYRIKVMGMMQHRV
jgi:hypothetical protein